MSAAPKLPAGEISPDGKEIWDWADRLSDAVAHADEIKQLRASINHLENHCGSCRLWWTKACPREVSTGRGMSKGPSTQSPKCQLHELKNWDREQLEDQKAKLAALTGASA